MDIEALRSDSGEPTRYTLVNSTKYGKWKVYYENTNCYGYALGKKNVARNIGYYSDLKYEDFKNYIETGNVKQLSIAFEDDLESLGYTVTRSKSAPSATTLAKTGNVVFCIRIHQGPLIPGPHQGDFHVMRYNQTAKGWVHKPGDSQVLKYKYQDAGTTIWTDEGMYSDGIPLEPVICYESTIYYFVCTPHRHIYEEVTGTGDTSAHTCLCMLCGKNFYQAHSLNASGSACIVCGRKPPFTKSRFICGVGCEIALPQTNHEAFIRKFYPDNNDQ